MNENCRICLIEKEKNQFIHLDDKISEEKTVLQIIIDCAPIEVLKDDPLPQVVCMNCLEKIQSFYELRQLILNSDATLKTNLSPNKYGTLQEKESIDTNHTNINNLHNNDDCRNRSKVNNAMVQNKEVKYEPLQCESLNNSDGNTNLTSMDDKNDLKKYPKYINNVEKEGHKRSRKSLRKLKRMYECKECNKIFKKADHYTVHMTKHTGEKKYACEFCPKRFARSYVLIYHRRVHTGERPYTCDICSKSFSSPSNFYTHKKIHTGERNYKCEMCSESFIQSDSLKIHVRRIHTGERPFLCEICSSAFRSNSSLLTHKLDMHGKKEACPVCNKLYSSRVLKQHVRRHKEREQGIKRFVCDQCGKRFTCSSSRKKHLLIHSGEKPFSCENTQTKMRNKLTMANN